MEYSFDTSEFKQYINNRSVLPVSTWKKPDDFVSHTNESRQNRSHSEEKPETDSKEAESDSRKEGSENELQKTKRNVQVSHVLLLLVLLKYEVLSDLYLGFERKIVKNSLELW